MKNITTTTTPPQTKPNEKKTYPKPNQTNKQEKTKTQTHQNSFCLFQSLRFGL